MGLFPPVMQNLSMNRSEGKRDPGVSLAAPQTPNLVLEALAFIFVLLNTQKIREKQEKWEKTSPFPGAKHCHHPKATKDSSVPISP